MELEGRSYRRRKGGSWMVENGHVDYPSSIQSGVDITIWSIPMSKSDESKKRKKKIKKNKEGSFSNLS